MSARACPRSTRSARGGARRSRSSASSAARASSVRRDAAEIQPTPPRADLTSANISASSSHPGCIQKTLEQISLYALIYVATEGTSFCKGAVKTYQLLATSSAIWVMLMIKTALAFAMRVSVVVFVTMVCYLYLDNQARDRRDISRDMRGDDALPPPPTSPHPLLTLLYVMRSRGSPTSTQPSTRRSLPSSSRTSLWA